MFDGLLNDLKDVNEVSPVIPAGDYNGMILNWEADSFQTKDGVESEVIRVMINLQNNPGCMLSDKSAPADGQNVEYTIFLPKEEDKQLPAKFGRGSMYDVSVKKIKRFFKQCGVNLDEKNTLDEAFDDCVNAQVVVTITNYQSEDGTVYDRVSKIS